MTNLLQRMADSSAARAAAARERESEPALRARIAHLPPPSLFAAPAFSLIAEIKTRSPSEGVIAAPTAEPRGEQPADTATAVAARRDTILNQARAYARAGAAAISVLTEPAEFGGSLDDLRLLAAPPIDAPLPTPLMRKDFLVDPYQVLEARAAGAAGVLLILRMLTDDALLAMLRTADQLGLFTLLEAFDRADLRRAGELLARAPNPGPQPRLVGLNTRDLTTLHVDPAALERLAADFPPGSLRIAESGLATADDAARVAGLGYHGALVGTSLMRSPDPHALAAAMISAGSASMRSSAAGPDSPGSRGARS